MQVAFFTTSNIEQQKINDKYTILEEESNKYLYELLQVKDHISEGSQTTGFHLHI